MTSLKAHVSLCGLVHALDLWRAVLERYRSELEQNRTIALAFGLKPALHSDYILHAPLPASTALRSTHMSC